MEGCRAGGLEGWKAGRLEGWKAGRLEGRAGRQAGTERRLPDVLKLGGPMPLLLDLVQMICLSCLNVRVFKTRHRRV